MPRAWEEAPESRCRRMGVRANRAGRSARESPRGTGALDCTEPAVRALSTVQEGPDIATRPEPLTRQTWQCIGMVDSPRRWIGTTAELREPGRPDRIAILPLRNTPMVPGPIGPPASVPGLGATVWPGRLASRWCRCCGLVLLRTQPMCHGSFDRASEQCSAIARVRVA